ncbi:MAG: HAD family hydrolase [Bacteroidales bacterium]|nr:HAD family hydrolase [Bacteroidales bacterium]MCF8387862.1 HAD family hydrolase [Bacteroidales bacterium]MCF8399180.1 HAD family hydrolase [Bacteroidales bacterium]
MQKIETILWDYNGTILDDADLCVQSMNTLLKKRGLPLLSLSRYQEIFTFPVKDYYEKAGFDLINENFNIPATEFIEIYKRQFHDVGIFKNIQNILQQFKDSGFRQFILSAMKKEQLIESVYRQKVDVFFEEILGIDDHYANGKEHLAKSLLDRKQLVPEQICIIGDTLHDHEIAAAIGCECILFSGGHQSRKRLKASGRKVIENIEEVKEIFSI